MGTPIRALERKAGKWFATDHFTEADVAFKWGIDLDKWAELSEWARARMYAYCNVKAMMNNYEMLRHERRRNA